MRMILSRIIHLDGNKVHINSGYSSHKTTEESTQHLKYDFINITIVLSLNLSFPTVCLNLMNYL